MTLWPTAEADVRSDQVHPAPIRLALVVSHPSPHLKDLLDVVSTSPAFRARTFYFRGGNPERLWRDEFHNGEFIVLRSFPFCAMLPRWVRLIAGLKAFEPDVVGIVADYHELTVQILTRWLRANKQPWFVYNEAPRITRGGVFRRVFKAVALGALKSASGAMTIGSKGLYIYRDIIGPGKPIFPAAYYRRLDPLLMTVKPAPTNFPLRLIYFGRLLRLKRLDLVVEAVNALDPGTVTLDIYGAGPELSTLQRMMAPEVGRVTFHPWVEWEELPSILARYDCLVFGSEEEGWGMMLVEAMAAGLVVIARNTIGSADIVQSGENGVLLSDFSFKDDLIATLRWLAADPAAVSRLGSAARATGAAEVPEKGGALMAKMCRTLLETQEGGKRRTGVWRSADVGVRNIAKSCLAILAPRKPIKYRGLRAVFYHFVDAHTDHFEEHLKWLADHFSVRDLNSDCDSLFTGDQGMAITFDDCFESTVESACEVLAKYNLRGAFFIPTAFLSDPGNRKNSWLVRNRLHVYDGKYIIGARTVRALGQAGHVVGSHSHSHQRLAEASESAFADELLWSRRILEDLTGQKVKNLAYPYGDVPTSRLSAVAASGYSLGWTIRRGVNTETTSRLLLRREHVEGNWTLAKLRFFLSR